ncbi:MAG TPA: CHAT domain-containing protein [Pyrinomonadaceae bacterium]|jgi:CHAT domain-containing protein/tetratricopeptide (TPR) repeat protein
MISHSIPTHARRRFIFACVFVFTIAPATFSLMPTNARGLAAGAWQDKRATADRLHAEGQRLVAEATPDALRRAIEKYKEALRLRRESGDRAGEGETHGALAFAYHTLHEYEQAIAHYREALRIYPDEPNILYNIARDFVSLSQYAEAVEYFTRALAVNRRAGDRLAEADALIGLADAYDGLNRYEKSVEYLEQALAIHRAQKNRQAEGVALTNLGNAYLNLGSYRKAIEYYQRAEAIYAEVRDRRNEATTLSNIGFAFFNLEQPTTAAQFYDRALALHRELRDDAQEANTLTKKCLVESVLRRFDRALADCERALALHRAVRNRLGEGRTLDVFGRTARAQGKHREAVAYLQRSLRIAREINARARGANTLAELMMTWKALGETRLAIFYGKLAVNAYQEIRSNIQRLDPETQRAFIDSKQDAYRTLAGLLISQERFGEAQQVLDMHKEEEFFEFIRRNSKEAETLKGRAALTPEESALKQTDDDVAAIGARWGALNENSARTPVEESELKSLEQRLEVANAAFQQFIDALSQRLTSAGQTTARAKQLQETQAQREDLRELGAGTVALYTNLERDRYSVILITRETQLAREVAIDAAALNEKIFAFKQVLKDDRYDPLPLAQELYRILVAPVAKQLKDAHAETLMWSLDGALRYIPIAALHDGEKYLVESYRNVVFTSGSLGRLRSQPSAAWKVLGFGVSKKHPDFTALPAVPQELRGIVRDENETTPAADSNATAAHPTTANPTTANPTADANAKGILPGLIMLDEAFTEETMRAALRRRYPVVHIASHFNLPPGNESDSFLLLGDGSHLALDKIQVAQNLFSGVELLTLSACDTASGSAPGADGKEVDSFGIIAQRQGAKAVIASLWPVADASTQLLMQSFYRLRQAQPAISKAEAMQQAQLALLHGQLKPTGTTGNATVEASAASRSKLSAVAANTTARRFTRDPDAPFAHPYFWAPFILIGNWR